MTSEGGPADCVCEALDFLRSVAMEIFLAPDVVVVVPFVPEGFFSWGGIGTNGTLFGFILSKTLLKTVSIVNLAILSINSCFCPINRSGATDPLFEIEGFRTGATGAAAEAPRLVPRAEGRSFKFSISLK